MDNEVCEDQEEISCANENTGWSRFRISVEPVLFAVSFIITFTDGVIIDLMEGSVCSYKLDIPMWNCMNNISDNEQMKTLIRAETAQVSLITSLVKGLFPLLLTFFIGPWSDQNGRKPFIISSLIGYTSYTFLWGVMSVLAKVKLYYFIIPYIPLSLSGGVVALFICSFAYICDSFPAEKRTLRFTIAVSSFHAGNLLASFVSARIFKAAGDNGFAVVFFTCMSLGILMLLYTTFFVPESIVKKEIRDRCLFNFKFLKSVIMVLFIRPKNEVINLFFVIIILLTEILVSTGEGSVTYLIGKSEFDWTLFSYYRFNVFVNIIAVLSPPVFIWIFKGIFKLDNFKTITIFGVLLFLTEALRAFSWNEATYWVFSGLTKLSALIGPTIGSELSNIVPKKDLGKIYAFSSMVDALSLFLTAPIYTKLFKSLIYTHVLYVFFFSSLMGVIISLSALCYILKNKKTQKYYFNK